MNREAGQNPRIASQRQKCLDDLDPEKFRWLIWLSINWKCYSAVNQHSENRVHESAHQDVNNSQATGNRELSPSSWWDTHSWDQHDGPIRNGAGTMTSESVRTHAVAIFCVCDGRMYTHTHLSHAHFSLYSTFCTYSAFLRTVAHGFSHVSAHVWLKLHGVSQKVVCCDFSSHLAISYVMSIAGHVAMISRLGGNQ